MEFRVLDLDASILKDEDLSRRCVHFEGDPIRGQTAFSKPEDPPSESQPGSQGARQPLAIVYSQLRVWSHRTTMFSPFFRRAPAVGSSISAPYSTAPERPGASFASCMVVIGETVAVRDEGAILSTLASLFSSATR